MTTEVLLAGVYHLHSTHSQTRIVRVEMGGQMNYGMLIRQGPWLSIEVAKLLLQADALSFGIVLCVESSTGESVPQPPS
jgi:hypothetical protein